MLLKTLFKQFKIDKEIDGDPIFIHDSRHLSDFDDEDKIRLSYNQVNCFVSHELNMKKDGEDDGMNEPGLLRMTK